MRGVSEGLEDIVSSEKWREGLVNNNGGISKESEVGMWNEQRE